jgi:hypothetical protein
VISDREIWQCALLIVKRYGDDAMHEAAARAAHGRLRDVAPDLERDRALAGEGAGRWGVGKLGATSPDCVKRHANNDTQAHTQHDSLEHGAAFQALEKATVQCGDNGEGGKKFPGKN